MIQIIVGTTLLLLGLMALSLQRFYSAIPARELKRLASRGDSLAANLYRPVAYGSNLRLLLWIIFGSTLSVGAALLSELGAVATFAIIFVCLIAVVWLWSIRLTAATAHFAAWCAPMLVKVLMYMHKPLDIFAGLIYKMRVFDSHSGLYEKDDLVALIRQQKDQADSRITPSQLKLVENVLQLHDYKVAEFVTPWKDVVSVNFSDKIGPILLSELHKSGQNVFVVYKEKPENVVGTLNLADAVAAKQGGSVSEIMRPNVSFAHEDFSLHQVFKAFAASGRAMVVVINSFEEAVGVITLQHALQQLLDTIGDDDLAYEDRKTVAAWRPQLEPVRVPISDDVPPQASSESPEVVE